MVSGISASDLQASYGDRALNRELHVLGIPKRIRVLGVFVKISHTRLHARRGVVAKFLVSMVRKTELEILLLAGTENAKGSVLRRLCRRDNLSS